MGSWPGYKNPNGITCFICKGYECDHCGYTYRHDMVLEKERNKTEGEKMSEQVCYECENIPKGVEGGKNG